MKEVYSYKKNNQRNISRGFALLIAVLTTSIVLAISTAIFNITIKELKLSSLSRESQYALQAADSGIECALYWGLRDSELLDDGDPITDDYAFPRAAGEDVDEDVTCFDEKMKYMPRTNIASADSATTTFFISTPYCVTLEIAKSVLPLTDTVIISRGYNTCDTSNPNRVERAIRAIY